MPPDLAGLNGDPNHAKGHIRLAEGPARRRRGDGDARTMVGRQSAAMGRAGHWTEARHARPRPHRVGHLRRQGRRVADHESAQRQRRARHVLRQRPLRRDLARRRQGDRQAGPRHCRARLSAGSAARLHDAGRGKRQHQTIARHPGEDFRRAASWLDQPGAGVDRAHQRESRRRGPQPGTATRSTSTCRASRARRADPSR